MSDTMALRINGLKFRYDAHSDWVVDVSSLMLARGEQALLTGASGAGKSSLLHLIAGLLEPDEGRIEVAGECVHAKRGAARDLLRGRTIGMIFQTFNLLHGFTAAENVMAAMLFSSIPRGAHRSRAAALLERLSIDRPEAMVDELSVGQQQRVAVARALACDPALVLADEPTASLDPDAGAAAIELIQSLCREKGAALLCVGHDPALAARFERRERFEGLGAQRAAAAT